MGGERTRRRRRRVRGAVLGCVLALLPATWLRLTTDGRVGEDLAEAPRAPVALVFGAGLRDGRPSPYLAHRLDAAVRLYRAGTVRVLLVSGDHGRRDHDEPGAMRRYLLDRGVPPGRVVSDHAGFDTWDSCARAARVFGVRRALLVSQDYHVRRAAALCRAAGIDAYGVAVPEPRDATWYAGGLRELPGAVKAAYDAAFTPDPRFPGPREPGVRRALAASGAHHLPTERQEGGTH
ncbi:SanA/YdcF family protein [Streptomyces sp. AA1529]|uniref:SanA/YdcF family protein n=1 Tax=Streptomyces sp. AA1529 TaxID=1203257 RepID=UPI001ED923D2|nr:ElyC/SanA/YdcF family protein [Streptomyces sp. AA1529]